VNVLRRSGWVAAILLMAANLLWAGQGIAVRLLAGTLSPLAVALLPLYFITLVGLVFLCFREDALQRLRMAWRFRREFFFAGICGQLVAQVGMTIGISWSSASNGAILSLLIPIFGAVLAVWLLRERLSILRMGVLLLGLAGILLVSPLQLHGHSTAHAHQFAGNILIVFGCFGSAFYNVYSKRLLAHFSELEILFFSYLSTTVFSLPVLFFFEPHCLSDLVRLSPAQWIALQYLAVFLYGLSMVLFLRALRMVDAIIASGSLYLTPLFGVVLAYSVLKERLASQVLVGAAILLFAALLLFRFDAPLEMYESLARPDPSSIG
jgi:drug/metabolite transporter (DMT)-like permease